MTVRDRVYSAFKESFDLDDETNTSKLVYQAYPAWTSIGHMILVAALESEFDTMLETDDILEMSNFEKTVSIMANTPMMLEAEENAAERKQLVFLSRGNDLEPPQPQ